MAAGDVTVCTPFMAGDKTAAAVNIKALGIVAGDQVIVWQESNQVFVAKIKTA